MFNMSPDDLAAFLLAQLVDDMGGVVEMDANKLTNAARAGSYNAVKIIFVDDKLVLETGKYEDFAQPEDS
jgi:hypothetical protein